MCFETNPSLFGGLGPGLRAGKKGPAPAGIGERPGFKDVPSSRDLERLVTMIQGRGRAVVAPFDSVLSTRVPQRLIQIEARYPSTGRRYLRVDFRVVQEDPRAANLRRLRDQIAVVRPQQFLEQGERFRRHKLSTNLMSGKMPALDEQNFRAEASRGDRRSATRRPTANDDQVVSH